MTMAWVAMFVAAAALAAAFVAYVKIQRAHDEIKRALDYWKAMEKTRG